MYHNIQGRAALKSDAMLARFQQAGGKLQWLKTTQTECEAEFSHPQGGTTVIRWGMEDAKRANLAGKENWRTYPRQMLRARVISEGVRATFPGVITGVYTPEEVADFTDAPSAELKQAEGATIQAEPEVKRQKVATVTGEVKAKKPEWNADQTAEAGRLRTEINKLGGDKEAVELWRRMKYDAPSDVIDAMAELLRKWQDIDEEATPVAVVDAEGAK
jgi:hypothetical protein